MPHRVSVACLACGSEATFEFAELVRIKRKRDVPFFQKSKLFDHVFFGSRHGGRWHAAVYYHGLRGRSLQGAPGNGRPF